MARKKLGTLSEQMYYVLLVLREERCGAQIAEAVDALTQHRVSLGPGTLYALLIIILLSALITFLFVTPSASDLPQQIQSPVMRHIIGEQNDICFDYVEVAHPSLLPVTKRYFLTDHAMDRALYVHEPLEQPYTEPELRAIIARMKENSGT